MADLLTCPFCGGNASFFRYVDMGFNRIKVGCSVCLVSGGSDHDTESGAEALASFWNRRAALPKGEPGQTITVPLALLEQFRNDLASAHAEICKLAGIDPETHSWPDWSPQANTLRWIDKLATTPAGDER